MIKENITNVGWAIDRRADIDAYHAHGKSIIFDIANIEDYIPFERGMYNNIQKKIINIIKTTPLSFPIMWVVNIELGYLPKNFSFRSDCELSQNEIEELNKIIERMEKEIITPDTNESLTF